MYHESEKKERLTPCQAQKKREGSRLVNKIRHIYRNGTYMEEEGAHQGKWSNLINGKEHRDVVLLARDSLLK